MKTHRHTNIRRYTHKHIDRLLFFSFPFFYFPIFNFFFQFERRKSSGAPSETPRRNKINPAFLFKMSINFLCKGSRCFHIFYSTFSHIASCDCSSWVWLERVVFRARREVWHKVRKRQLMVLNLMTGFCPVPSDIYLPNRNRSLPSFAPLLHQFDMKLLISIVTVSYLR